MPKIERVETIYGQGTAKDREDGFCVNPPVVGVVDGLSAPYHYKMERPLFDGMSGGEMVREEILEVLYSTDKDEPLEEVLLRANERVGFIQSNHGISLARADLLAGASIAVAKLSPEEIDILQAGDCFAIWITNEGKIGVTKNQAHLHEVETWETWRKIQQEMGERGRDRREVWVEFHEPLSRLRLRDINQPTALTGYGLLNGQAAFRECWQKVTIPWKGLKLLMLFTDGLLPLWLNPGKEGAMARQIVTLYQKKGLKGILEKTRISEKKEKERHMEHGEATGIVIEFE